MRLWGCILEFVSRGSFIWSLFWDHSHLLWGYVGPYFNFHSFFGSLLGIIPKKCPYLTFSFWYLNAIKQWTAVLNKQSPDEKVNNAFVPFANSIAARSCTSNGLLIVRRTIKKVYKVYKIHNGKKVRADRSLLTLRRTLLAWKNFIERVLLYKALYCIGHARWSL